MSVGRTARVLPCLLAALLPSLSHADTHHTVALVRPDSQWLRAVNVSLSAWDITVVGVDVPGPGSALPEAQSEAEDVARTSHADAVVWLTRADPGCVLWIYDVATMHVGSRVLGDRPPFDDPTAAAAALSVKALLRSSPLAPPDHTLAAPAISAPVASVLWIEADAGARLIPPSLVEPRVGLGIAVWPRLLDNWGVGVEGAAGLGVPLSRTSPTFLQARFSEVSASASARKRVSLGRVFALEPALGGSLHFTTVRGSALADDEAVLAHRIDGSLDAALSLDLRAGGTYLGLRAGAEVWLVTQRYLVEGVTVLSLAPFMASVVLRLRAGLM